jgi:hypothetical protein
MFEVWLFPIPVFSLVRAGMRKNLRFHYQFHCLYIYLCVCKAHMSVHLCVCQAHL